MGKFKREIFKIGVACSFLLLSVTIAGAAFKTNVAPMANDGVLRVIYYGGIKGNIAPCG